MIVDNLEFHVKRSGDTAARGTEKLSKSLKNLKGSSGDANKGLGSMMHTIGRMAKLMVLRQTIRALIKAMQEGLKSAYAFNSMAGGEMSAALDKLQSAAVQARGALGSAFGEILANVAPALIAIKNLIITVANAFAQLMAVLGGRSTYTKAVASSEKWAKATETGAKAAKEWKNQLMGFDEINRLEEPSETGGGSSGNDPYEGAFELVEAQNEWAKQFREITLDWLNNLNFEPLLEQFEKLKKAAKDFAGIVDDALYWAYTEVLLPLGKWTIEKGAPAAIEALASALAFLNTVLRWLQPYALWIYENWLKPIANWAGDKFVDTMNKISKIFDDLTKYFEDLQKQDLTLPEAITKIFKDLKKAIIDQDWDAIGTDLGQKIIDTFNAAATWAKANINSVDWDSLVQACFEAIGAAFAAGWRVLDKASTELAKKLIQKYDKNGNGRVDMQDIGKALVQGVYDGMKLILQDFGGWVIDNVFKPIVKGFKDAFGIHSPSTVFAELGGYLMDGLGEGMKNNFNPVQTAVDAVKQAISGIASTVSGAISSVYSLYNESYRATLQMNQLNSATATHISMSGNVHGGSGGAFAEGGFPDTGELFVARESGPELVGSIGNRTAVANNDQIIAGIRQGVFEAVTQAMSNQSGGEVVLKLDGDVLAKGVTRYQRFNAISANI